MGPSARGSVLLQLQTPDSGRRRPLVLSPSRPRPLAALSPQERPRPKVDYTPVDYTPPSDYTVDYSPVDYTPDNMPPDYRRRPPASPVDYTPPSDTDTFRLSDIGYAFQDGYKMGFKAGWDACRRRLAADANTAADSRDGNGKGGKGQGHGKKGQCHGKNGDLGKGKSDPAADPAALGKGYKGYTVKGKGYTVKGKQKQQKGESESSADSDDNEG